MSGYATVSIRSSYWNGSRLASWGGCLEIVFTNHCLDQSYPSNSAMQIFITATHQHPCACQFLCQPLVFLNDLYSCIMKHSCSSLQERLGSFLAVYRCPLGGLVRWYLPKQQFVKELVAV